MGKVVSSAMMSLDGYVAKADNTIGELFEWLGNGEVEIDTVSPGITVHVTAISAEYWREWIGSLGALVCGRVLFDITDGWNGRHTLDVPVVVVTHEAPTDWVDAHPDAPFTFATDGVAALEWLRARHAGLGDSVVVPDAGYLPAAQRIAHEVFVIREQAWP